MVDQVCHRLSLAEREHVRLGAGSEERDLQRPLAHRVVLEHELVQAAVPEHAVPVLVDVPPCDGPGASPSRSTRKGIGSRVPGDSRRCVSRAWKR
jgi:hypothetical protein